MDCEIWVTRAFSRRFGQAPVVLRKLDNMLRAMRCSMFHPDRTRSGLVTPAAIPVVPGAPFQIPQAPAPQTPLPMAGRPVEKEAADHGRLNAEKVVREVQAQSPGSETSWAHLPGEQQYEPDASSEGIQDSETTEEDSVQSTSDSDVEAAEDQRVDQPEPTMNFFINEKSLVIHCERTAGVLKCGRKVSAHFAVVYKLH